MKFRILFKDPDAVYEAIRDAVIADVGRIEGLSGDEREDIIELRQKLTAKACSKWIEHDEYLEVECDTDAGTARIVPVGESRV